MSSIRRTLSILLCVAMPGLAHAAGDACHGEMLSATPVRPNHFDLEGAAEQLQPLRARLQEPPP